MTQQAQIFARKLLVAAFGGMLLASLGVSLSSTAGHADQPIAATAAETRPLSVGDPAPTFQVRTVDGASMRFDPELLENPVILVSFRGGWCPYCNMHLSELRHVLPEIQGLGVDVYFLSGDRPDQLYRSLEADTQREIDGRGYTILSDADANAATALGIAFRASENTINRRHQKGQDIEGSSMSRHAVLPVPAIFAIDTSGNIAFAFSSPDYKIRLPAAELLAVARRLAQQ